jgi:hypothetical protein
MSEIPLVLIPGGSLKDAPKRGQGFPGLLSTLAAKKQQLPISGYSACKLDNNHSANSRTLPGQKCTFHVTTVRLGGPGDYSHLSLFIVHFPFDEDSNGHLILSIGCLLFPIFFLVFQMADNSRLFAFIRG